MQERICSPPGKILGDFWRNLPKHLKITFFATFIAGVLTHGYVFSNFLLNHDGMSYFLPMVMGDTLRTLSSGRWFQDTALSLSGTIPVPWVIGLLSVFYLSLTATVVAACLELKRALYAVLVGVVLVTFPSAGVVFAYVHVADSIFLSVFLACLAAFVCKKFRFGFFFGAIILAFSLGIVQTYITMTAGLLVMMLILDILSKQERIQTLLLRSFKYLSCLVLGLVIYFLVLRYMLTTQGVTLSEYQGIDQMGQMPFYRYWALIQIAYQEFFSFFTAYTHDLPAVLVPISLPLILILVMLVLLVMSRPSNKDSIPQLILLLVLLALFPLAVTAIFIMGVHFIYLMLLYALSLVLVLMIALLDRLDISLQSMNLSVKKYIGVIACWISLATLVLIPYAHAVTLNGNYLQTDLVMRQTAHVSSTLTQRIRSFPGYVEGMPVVLVGYHTLGSTTAISQMQQHSPIFGFPTTEILIHWHSYQQFFEIFLGENMNLHFLRYNTTDGANFDTISALSIFPADGSMVIIDGALFIRMGH